MSAGEILTAIVTSAITGAAYTAVFALIRRSNRRQEARRQVKAAAEFDRLVEENARWENRLEDSIRAKGRQQP